ncbi:hypothetical protein AMTR_s00156p00017410 [Amborella trichopoda]|uniref:Uncharacterized protein n=1 Tax=Amborella trichopoda TaxID=13333 RepID=W1PEB8_AMBTC|nr:hypothetical protein AMTR_s00156p00017410 [Amborella trichopoda]
MLVTVPALELVGMYEGPEGDDLWRERRLSHVRVFHMFATVPALELVGMYEGSEGDDLWRQKRLFTSVPALELAGIYEGSERDDLGVQIGFGVVVITLFSRVLYIFDFAGMSYQ